MHIPNGLSQTRLFRLVKQQLRQGSSTRELSRAIVLGVVLGIIPVVGFITAVCAAIAAWLRLNVALSLAVLYAVMPLQLLLFVPFIRLGEQLFRIRRLPLAPERIVEQVQTDPWNFTINIWESILGALGAWLLVSLVLGFTLYHLLVILIRQYRD
jgi:uncharacterized protein (DUF2062 family)